MRTIWYILTHQSEDLTKWEKVFSDDLEILNTYFYKWRLNSNPAKTETCAFHLYNKQSNKELKVQFKDMTVRHNASPKYFGMTLDHTLSYKKHLETTKMKVSSRINLLQKLAGTGWGYKMVKLLELQHWHWFTQQQNTVPRCGLIAHILRK